MDKETNELEKELTEKLKKIGLSDEQIEEMLSNAKEKCHEMAKIVVKKHYH